MKSPNQGNGIGMLFKTDSFLFFEKEVAHYFFSLRNIIAKAAPISANIVCKIAM